MKHIFIVNPCAGRHDSGDDIAAAIDMAGLEAEVYATMGPRDASHFVGQWLVSHPNEEVRFYACGGDGTLNEVVAGVLASEQTARVEVGCYPCGSGNDFVKTIGNEHPDIEALCKAESKMVDVFCIQSLDGGCRQTHYSINTLNFGFEAAVCRSMDEVRRWPLIGGRMAYITGIVHSLLHKRRHRCNVSVDGTPWYDGELLLLSMANGQWAGGGFHCAPRASITDGLIDVMGITPLSIPKFVGLIKYYKNGELLDSEELQDIVHYTRGRCVTIEADSHAVIAADGEVFYGQRFDIECLPGALRFIQP